MGWPIGFVFPGPHRAREPDPLASFFPARHPIPGKGLPMSEAGRRSTPPVARSHPAFAVAEAVCWFVGVLTLVIGGYGAWWTRRVFALLNPWVILNNFHCVRVIAYFAGCLVLGCGFLILARRVRVRPAWLVAYLGASAVAAGYFMGELAR